MQIEITENGTKLFYLRPGTYRMTQGGTLASGALCVFKGGDAEDGSDHEQIYNAAGTAIQFSSTDTLGPEVVIGGGWHSIVTTGFGASSSPALNFRRVPVS